MMSSIVVPTDSSERPPREHIGSLVAIRPGRTLVFNVDSAIKRLSRNITVRNVSDVPVTYKIKTTSREGYRVKPHTGVLEVGQSADTVVTLLPHNQYRVPQDKFLVMAAKTGNNRFKAKDKRKMENFWKKVSKDKSSPDYMEHQLSCALNADEFLANEEDGKIVTISESDHRLKDDNEFRDDYITPESSVLLRRTPVQRTSYEDSPQLERSSEDYMQSVTPPSEFTASDYIVPTLQANAQESVTPENDLALASAHQPVLTDDEFLTEETKIDSVFSDDTSKDPYGREKHVKRVFKSIMKKKRRPSPKRKRSHHEETPTNDVSKKPSKKVKVAGPTMKELMNASYHLPKMFTKVKASTNDGNSQQVSADEVVISLQRTEDVLNKHINCFKGFQVFVVIAICALCIIIIILMINFPSAISIHKAGPSR